ncbi:unnamed protein product [Microthlaspi erraticum]|uniref:F-box domain-containing protein n=1 Tax=Microthlaspi erraticum TaxID=1685480 RepID=A0A6D2HLR3_9BRAS|nr:unnamed protein product [Microthlaspi erraticum]
MASPIRGVDLISSMPDVILHHILSFTPIKLAIITSALSRRWRHVWCETPRLDLYGSYGALAINQTLNSYRAQKITSFDLFMYECVPEPQLDSWIEFAMSHNVEKMSLSLRGFVSSESYRFPDSFYLSSSLEELWLDFVMIPRCTVSWKSLRRLTLYYSSQSLADILSGCPVLETLKLFYCGGGAQRLDLSKSPSLKTLEIIRRQYDTPGSMEIVAPHVRFLELRSTKEPCTLVDASSLIEANLDIDGYDNRDIALEADDCLPLQNMVLKMLAKLRNVEELTFGTTFLQILSVAEFCGVHFPKLKVQTLTLVTMFAKSVIPGITRLLQNSPGLRKLKAYPTYPDGIEDCYLDRYLDSQGLNPGQCWRSKLYAAFPTKSDYHSNRFLTPKLVASFIDVVLKKVKTLETLTVVLEHIRERGGAKWFEKLLRTRHPTLSNDNNVTILIRE